MKKLFILLLYFYLCHCNLIAQKTMINTGFESSEGYNNTSLHGQNHWTVSIGNAGISNNPQEVKEGDQSLKISSANSKFGIENMGYDKTETGLSGIVYFDIYLKVNELSAGNIAVATYDFTPKSSKKRTMMFELLTPSKNKGKIKVYSGGSGSNVGEYSIGEWIRISSRIDIAARSYQIAINGTTDPTIFNFRESWDVNAQNRPSNDIEIHTIQLNGTADANTNVLIDNLFVSNNPISDVTFGGAENNYTIQVDQPKTGSITLTPRKNSYALGEQVTATCTIPEGYNLSTWTGDLSGNETSKTFSINKNMTIGATVQIDTNNPPTQYTISIHQPANGVITLSPQSADNRYYKHSKVEVSIKINSCFSFKGWTGSLTGTALKTSFTITENAIIGATIEEDKSIPQSVKVSNSTELKTALAAITPGTEIIVADGIYDIGGVKLTSGGCEAKPVLIRAENIGGAKFINKSYFNFVDVEYVTIEGFVFESTDVTVLKIEDSRYCRFTRNTFRLKETTSVKWILIGGYYSSTEPLSWHNRIDHNLFEGKTQGGNYITLDGCTACGQQTQYDRIDHNHFRNLGPRAENEKETIRVGCSGLSFSSGYTTIEYNLFEDCDGDPEIVSVKSSDNIIRYNTFRRCLGTLSLRQGFRSRAEGNYFFGEGKTGEYNNGEIGCGGIRAYSIDHVIVNNYFEGLTGSKWDPAFALTNGDVTNSSTSQSSHMLPENILFAHNTLINNQSDIEIGFSNGGKYGKLPKNCKIENNLIVNNTHTLIKLWESDAIKSVSFSKNIFYPTGSATMGIDSYTPDQINNADPGLEQQEESYHLSAKSIAIDAARPLSNVTLDFEGQIRESRPDIGADEYSASPIKMRPLTAEYVGPLGKDIESETSTGITQNPQKDDERFPSDSPYVIYNLSGQAVDQGVSNEDGTITSRLEKGIYIVHFSKGVTKKLYLTK